MSASVVLYTYSCRGRLRLPRSRAPTLPLSLARIFLNVNRRRKNRRNILQKRTQDLQNGVINNTRNRGAPRPRVCRFWGGFAFIFEGIFEDSLRQLFTSSIVQSPLTNDRLFFSFFFDCSAFREHLRQSKQPATP